METRCRKNERARPRRGIKATTEVSDDLLQAKSKVRKAVNELCNNRCSSNPSSDFLDPSKKTKLKSF